MNVEFIQEKPALFTQSQDSIWLDGHVSTQMLTAHLSQATDGASRKESFIEKSVEWLVEVAALPASARVLDLGCGPGLYAEKFARRNFQVVGIDFSVKSIDYARQQTEKKQTGITYYCQDYLQGELGTSDYELILLAYCDFGVFSPENRQKVLTKCFQALAPGGKLIFDVFTPAKYRDFTPEQKWQLEEKNFWSAERCLHLQKTETYPAAKTYLDQHYLIGESWQKEFFIWETVFEPAELLAECHTSGFTKSQLYGDLKGSPYDATSETLCVVLEK